MSSWPSTAFANSTESLLTDAAGIDPDHAGPAVTSHELSVAAERRRDRSAGRRSEVPHVAAPDMPRGDTSSSLPRGQAEDIDRSAAPLLDALVRVTTAGTGTGSPRPGPARARVPIHVVAPALASTRPFPSVLAPAGLDDRARLRTATCPGPKELMAAPATPSQAFFSTCGGSLSVKAAMLAVAGGPGHLLIGPDARESVVSGLVLFRVQPQSIRPRYDPGCTWRTRLAGTGGTGLAEHPDAAGALIVSPTPSAPAPTSPRSPPVATGGKAADRR